MTSAKWIASVSLALALAATADAQAGQAGKGNGKDDDGSPGNSGQAAANRGNGLRAPTREETEALLQQMSRYTDQSSAGLTIRSMPNGARMVDLQDRFQEIAIAKKGANGVEFACVDSVSQARAFLEGQTPAKPAMRHSHAPQRSLQPLEEK